ncbi:MULTISPECIES: hypothetical protein [Streptomyces]|uniref:hypothetical protein n=1 Tax=Streptomyces TaxID=1883 RepID=UPI0013167CC2|nr:MULTISPECIES: hypothetical protein [Streptomyces]QGZ50759.1 hypothetical protein GPZ77_22415 [Streptomyces sp. QHH-9511]GGT82808.1 hypothetical protein GCM10010272_29300 [Streptomyces lateritius]
MRRIALSAASVLVLSALLGCFTASHATQASATVQQHALATEAPAGIVAEPRDNHGND